MSGRPDSGSAAAAAAADKEKAKRGYRACLHCRSRKAKCDLGDIDAPSKPPCTRCRRESRECVFAPSRRGGNNKRRRDDEVESGGGGGGGHHSGGASGAASSSSALGLHGAHRNGYGSGSSVAASASRYAPNPPHVDVLNPSPKPDYLFNHPSNSSNDMSPSTVPSGPSPVSAPARLAPDGGPRHGHLAPPPPPPPPHEKRRRLHLNPLDPTAKADPSSLVVADMQNESDALHILALASAGEGERGAGGGRNNADRPGSTAEAIRRRASVLPPIVRSEPARMDEFALIRLGVIDEDQAMTLISAFFRFHHHLFPMVPADRIPRTPEQTADFACTERYLVTAMIIIASRHNHSSGMREVHERTWAVMRGWIGEITCLGSPPTVGLVEALLLLAENLPRDPPRSHTEPVHAPGFGEEVHGVENRQAWMLIGMAIRCAYGLGIDKLALKLIPEVDRTYDVERARLVWTYCYLFDRHVSLRLGKAFWSRGPVLCFQGFSASAQTGPAAAPGNFPFLTEIKAPKGAAPGDYPEQEDLASLVQTYLELTQLMSNAHDVLYPNAARTRSLVVYGEYFKYIDELTRSLDGFKILWLEKKWTLFPLTDAVWAMFYYTQLYICAFSFQAHVERAAMRAEEVFQEQGASGSPQSISLFPRGAAASPDARYIFQSIDTARQLLHICVDSLHPGGALPYLPNRFLLWFTYAAIMLLKTMYSGAMLRADHEGVHKLIDRLCECFADASPDNDHPAVRYGHQLQALRHKLAGMQTSANSPTGGNTVPLPGGSGRGGDASTPYGRSSSPVPPARSARGSWIPGADGGDWAFPASSSSSQPAMSFPYGVGGGGSGVPGGGSAAGAGPSAPIVGPPHEQPLSDIVGNLYPHGGSGYARERERESISLSVGNNLGFATLDDWFSNPAGGANPFESLDLADFWMKGGTGDVQAGFPFR